MNTQPTEARRAPATDAEPLWTTAELANQLRCSERHVLALRHQGLPTIKLGHLVRFEPNAVRQWLAVNPEVKSAL